MPLAQVIITILLMSAITATSVSFVSKMGVVERDLEASLKQGLHDLEFGWREYLRDHRRFECAVEAPEALCPGFVVSEPGYLPEAGWRAAFFPRYVFEPALPGGETLSYRSAAEGHYFCLQGTSNPALLRAAEALQKRKGHQKMAIGSVCGLTLQGTLPVAGGPWAITYWLNRH